MNRRVICILTTSAAALVPAAAFVPRTSCPAGASCLNMAPPGGCMMPKAAIEAMDKLVASATLNEAARIVSGM